ncbi:MAG: DUF58 domain-containing protein [Saprospiraceae bacterium]|nr:DUF58 domain-containing protein [Saprospiraceae bacterium]
MDTAELLKRVRKIEIKIKGLSKHIFSGEYHSAFKGRGMSFSEVRAYQPGDDVRNIDWSVTARTGSPHIKVFEEERELTVLLLVDVSNSVWFGTKANTKNEIITELSATLAFSAIQNNDNVGLLFFSDEIVKFISPQKGRQHILRIIRELIDVRPSATKTSLEKALQYLNQLVKKKAIIFIISDFICENYANALTIAARKHDVVGIRVIDEKEVSLPKIGLINVYDAETGKITLLDTNDEKVRNLYRDQMQHYYNYFKTAFSKAQADSFQLFTHESYIQALLGFFKKRSH